MSNEESDKEAILARRALLVTSTLAALGCSSPSSTGNGGTVDTVAVETVNVPPPASGTATAAPTSQPITPDPSRPKWASVIANAPSFDVPPAGAGVSNEEREALERQAKAMRQAYDTFGAAWDAAPPRCAPDACEADWAALAKQIGGILEGLRGPLCGWSDRQPISLIEREGAHHAFLQAQATALDAELAKTAQSVGQKTRWEEMRLGGAIPHPCLSCLQPAPRIFDTVGFDDDTSVLGDAQKSSLERIQQTLTADPKMRVQIRGHADAAEKGDKKALAKKRAEAVRDWLTKAGIAGARFQIVVLADAVPITASKGPDRGQNRRVDFERIK